MFQFLCGLSALLHAVAASLKPAALAAFICANHLFLFQSKHIADAGILLNSILLVAGLSLLG